MRFNFRKSAFIFSIIFAVIFSQSVLAATLQVTKIGSLDLGGKVYNEWWYTGEKPVLYGKAVPNSTVTITVDSISPVTAPTNAAGDWSYVSSLIKGDYKITVASAGESVVFSLHLGQELPANAGTGTVAQTTSTTPVTGSEQLLALSFSLGVLLLATYFYILEDPTKKSNFEAMFFKDN